MPSKSSLLLATYGLAALASPVTLMAPRADAYNTINFDDFDPDLNNGTLVKRQPWRWCVSDGNNLATCVNGGAAVGNVAVGIANAVKAYSNNHDCSYHHGEVEDTHYELHATGANCDTTAQEATIEGGLRTYFGDHGHAVCGVHCVHQTHGGTYNGYLLVAPKSIDLSQYTCDGSVNFDDGCGSGGKKDDP